MLMRKWDRRHSLRLSLPLSSTSAKLVMIELIYTQYDHLLITRPCVNKLGVKIHQTLYWSPEQINDGVSFGVMHLPSCLTDSFDEDLVMVMFMVICSSCEILMEYTCVLFSYRQYLLYWTWSHAIYHEWKRSVRINHHFASQSVLAKHLQLLFMI